jgi:hypothetical protein
MVMGNAFSNGKGILHLFTELMALPSNVIRIKCYDFEGPVKTIYPFVS